MIKRLALFVSCVITLGSVAFAAVEVGGLRYSIKSAARASHFGNEYTGSNAGGEFIVLRITISNTGKESATISASDFHLQSGDVKYDAANVIGDGVFFLEKLNPGISKTGVVVFDVPANTALSRYKLIVYGNGSGDRRDIQL